MNTCSTCFSRQATRVPSFLAALAAGFFATTSAHAVVPVAATFNSATDVPVTASSYIATGKSVDIALHFAPPVGTTLTVVNNTGLSFIQGTFRDLAQGRKLALTYHGVTYHFVADYYGGTGNDLVLHWADTKAVAWGWDGSGELGDNRIQPRKVLTAVNTTGVLSGKTIVSVAAGREDSLALCSDGTLAAWGINYAGQLGNNSTSDSHTPVAVDTTGVLAGKTVIAIAAGYDHNLALCSDGTLAAWGYNANGGLGNNTTTDSSVPVAVVMTGALAGKSVIAISAGYLHSLALCSDGTLAAWGYGGYGQLGNNDTADSSVPVLVDASSILAGKTVTTISAGTFFNIVLCSDGTVAGWGSDVNGQLGDGNTDITATPVAVDISDVLAGKTVISISAGENHTMVVCSDGTVAGWGDGLEGELGNNSASQSAVPVAADSSGVLAGKSVVSVAVGEQDSLVLCADGTVASWGDNTYGQLGDNSAAGSLVPVAVYQGGLAPGSRFVAVASGHSAIHTLGLIASPPRAAKPPAGSYSGLVEPQSDTSRSVGTEGCLTATLLANGTFSGMLSLDGQRNAITGEFNRKGVAHFGPARTKSLTITHTGRPDLVIELKFDLLNGLTGSVTQQTGSVISGVSIVQADHALSAASAGISGIFNVILPFIPADDGSGMPSLQPAGLTATDFPQSHGFGRLTIASSGAATFSGTLADGTAVAVATSLTGPADASSPTIPLFAQLYASGGFVSAGLIPDVTNPDSDLSTGIDYVHWARPLTSSPFYPNGWPQVIVTSLRGAQYVTTPGQSVIPGLAAPSSSGNALLQVDSYAYPLNLSSTDHVTFADPANHGFTLSINRATGGFSGTYSSVDGTHPALQGLIYQKGGYVGGWGFSLTSPAIGQSRAVNLFPQY